MRPGAFSRPPLLETISLVLVFLLILSPSIGFVFAADGALLFSTHCSECHGNEGQGGPRATPLKKEGMLVTTDLEYLINSIRYGRELSGCPSFEDTMERDDIEAIASYIKGWQRGESLSASAETVVAAYSERAEQLFALCGGCHGLEGQGAMGPPLLDPGFLRSATDKVLRTTIIYGRPGTPMKGYLKGSAGGGLAELTEEEIDELIAYIRYREKLALEGK